VYGAEGVAQRRGPGAKKALRWRSGPSVLEERFTRGALRLRGKREGGKMGRWEGEKKKKMGRDRMSGPAVLEERYFVSTLFEERYALRALLFRSAAL